MEDTRNRIRFTGMKPSRTFTKRIARSIEKWIDRKRTLLFLSSQTQYCVHVDQESPHCFTCHIEIRMGAREWAGMDEGRSPMEATLNALNRSPLLPALQRGFSA